MITLTQIPQENVDENWGWISDWVESSLGVDKSYSTNDVKRMCANGSVALWIIYNNDEPTGFLTTTISQAPQGKTCYAPWLGGKELGLWVGDGFDQLKDWLRSQGCVSLSWMGRAAWQKMIKIDSSQCFYMVNL